MAQHANRDDKLQALVGAERRARASAARGRRPEPPRQDGALLAFLKDNVVGILSVLAVSVIVVLMAMFLRGCNASTGGSGGSEKPSGEAVLPIDWQNLDRANGRYSYIVDGKVASRFGIDVSDNQHDVDWETVAADGVQFAMIRLGYRGATEGDLYLDGYYRANLDGAKAAGIDCGIYFFSQAISVEEAREEAEFVLANLGGATLEYPIAFDSEVIPSLGETRTASLSTEEMTAIADAFCERVEAEGYDTLVYGNYGDLTRYDFDNLDGRGIWWAEYGQPVPLTTAAIAMWQYANDGAIDGIDAAVDLNIDLRPAYGS